MKTWGTSLFAFVSLGIVAACGQSEPAKDPSSQTATTAAEPKKAIPAEAAKPVEEPKPAPVAETPAAPPAEEKAEPCPSEWVCVNVDYATGKITKRDTKLIGDPKVESTWSKSVDTRGPATFASSKPVDLSLQMPQTKAGEHLYNVMMKINGKQILLDKHTGEEVTYVGVIAAEKDGQFMVDLRYMK